MFAVFKQWDLMIGVDQHIWWPPDSPIPLPPTGFLTVMPLCGFFYPLSVMLAPTSWSVSGCVVQCGSNIGPGIPHMGPPSLLNPTDVRDSTSTSYFGPSAYQHEGYPCAAALGLVVGVNVNCQDPFPMPTGAVICITTHFTWLTPVDVARGVAMAIFSIVASKVLGAMWEKISPPPATLVGKLSVKMSSFGSGAVTRVGVDAAVKSLAVGYQLLKLAGVEEFGYEAVGMEHRTGDFKEGDR